MTIGNWTPARPCTSRPSAATSDSDLATDLSAPLTVTVTSIRTLRSEMGLPRSAAGGVCTTGGVAGTTVSWALASGTASSKGRDRTHRARKTDIRVLLGRTVQADRQSGG